MKEQVIILTHKKLVGDITAEELVVLDQLLQEGAASEGDEIAQIWDAAEQYEAPVTFDSDAAYQRMMSRIASTSNTASDESSVSTNDSEAKVISLDKQPAKVVSLFSIRNIAKLAAVFVLGLAAYSVMEFMSPTTVDGGAAGSYVSLEEGSSIWLSPNSKVTYGPGFSSDRSVQLEGKAYFDVARDEEHPFTITTDDLSVTVLGTSFVVDSEDDVVAVRTGKVKVESGAEEVLLTRGQKVNVDDNNILLASDADNSDFAWVSPILSFDNAPLDKVLNEVSVHYGVVIKYKGKRDLSSCLFTATNLNDATLEDVLSILRATYSMEVDTKSQAPDIVVSKVRCR